MAKTKLEQELEKKSQGELVRMCDAKGLDCSGGKDALIARLVALEKPKPEAPGPES